MAGSEARVCVPRGCGLVVCGQEWIEGEATAKEAGGADEVNDGTAKALKKQTKQQRVRRKISLKHD